MDTIKNTKSVNEELIKEFGDFSNKIMSSLNIVENFTEVCLTDILTIPKRLRYLRICEELINQNNTFDITAPNSSVSRYLIGVNLALEKKVSMVYESIINKLNKGDHNIAFKQLNYSIDNCTPIYNMTKYVAGEYYVFYINNTDGNIYIKNIGKKLYLANNIDGFSKFYVKFDIHIDRAINLDEIDTMNDENLLARINPNNPHNNMCNIYLDNAESSDSLMYLMDIFANMGINTFALHYAKLYMYSSYNWKEVSKSFKTCKHKGIIHSTDYTNEENYGKDFLIRTPEDSYENINNFIEQMVNWDKIDTLSFTLYRSNYNDKIIDYVETAVKNNKQVYVYLEGNASNEEIVSYAIYDRLRELTYEYTNFSLQYCGEYKVHAKVVLASGKDISYTLMSSGNFNDKSGNRYIDLAFISSKPIYVNYAIGLFDIISNNLKLAEIKDFDIYSIIEKEFQKEIAKGEDGYIRIKCNDLFNDDIVSLVRIALNAGVKVDCIIRLGVMDKYQLLSLTNLDKFRLYRVIGQYLQHERIFIFGKNDDKRVYCGSADLADRNLYNRLETFFPILDNEIADRLELVFHSYFNE